MNKETYGRKYFKSLFYRENLNSQRNRKRISELLRNKTSGRLFEIGFGEGNFLKKAGKYFSVEGCDISDFAGEETKKIITSGISVCDIEEAGLRNNYYDVIASYNLLEHLKNPKKVIRKVYKALKKNGILIGSVPNNSGIIGKISTSVMNLYDRTHISTYKPELWKNLFKENGFRSVVFFGEIVAGRNLCFYIKNSLWKHFSFNMLFVCRK